MSLVYSNFVDVDQLQRIMRGDLGALQEAVRDFGESVTAVNTGDAGLRVEEAPVKLPDVNR